MAIATQPPETDLFLPRPAAGEAWDPHTIHTHYFGFSVSEAAIGAFLYIRYQPAFPLAQGGVCIFRGVDNVSPLDVEFLDYQISMRWPEVDGTTITTANGFVIDFVEPGRRARLRYRSADGATSFDLLQTAVTPLFARGHVIPGEEKRSQPSRTPGGSEQFMRCVGELFLHGERFAVDCHAARDRSWGQIRTEDQDAVKVPPIGWSPMYFGDDLSFNQVGFESLDTDPAWKGLYDVPAGHPSHHFAWVHVGGESRKIVRVRRHVLERHPVLHSATKQRIEAEDETGRIYRFRGEAIAVAALPAWPNLSFRDSVHRWEDEDGRVTHCTYQEIWFDRYQRAMKSKRRR